MSYNVNPGTTQTVFNDMVAVMTLTAQELQNNGLNNNTDNITIRTRAFMPVGEVTAQSMKMYRFGKAHFKPNASMPAYSQDWWEFADGE